MPQAKKDNAAAAHARVAYMLELVRGCSYISSTLTTESLNRAVGEVLIDFRENHDAQQLEIFKNLLGQELERRDKMAAAATVRDFKFGSK